MAAPSLTAAEISVLCDVRFLQHKQDIDAKIKDLFAQLKANITRISSPLVQRFPEVFASGRTHRGENYHGLPHRELDFPAFISAGDMLLFRSIILWGDNIGFHLVLGGKYLDAFRPALHRGRAQLAAAGFFLSSGDTPWQWFRRDHLLMHLHSAEAENYIATQNEFVKCSAFLPLTQFADVPEHGMRLWKTVAGVLISTEQGLHTP